MPSGEPSADTLAERKRLASVFAAFRNAYVQPCDGCGDAHVPEVIRKPTLILLSILLGCELREDDTDNSIMQRMEDMMESLKPDKHDFEVAHSIFVTTINAAREMDMQNLAARAAANRQPNDKMMN